MSDNKNIRIQDRGWKEMQSLLDREIPVEKKKRMLLLWFILGAITIASLAFLGISESLSINSDSKIITTNETINNILSPTPKKNEIEVNASQMKIDEDDNTKVSIANEVKNNDVHTLQLAYKEPIKTNKRKELTLSEEPELKNGEDKSLPLVKQKENQLSNQVKHDLTNFEINYEAIPANDSNKEVQLNKQEYNQPKSLMPVFNNHLDSDQQLEKRSFLPSVFNLPFTIPFLKIDQTLEVKKGIKPIVIAQNKNSLSPYLFTAGNYQSSINGLGYEFGAGLDYKLNKMDIYFEVGYSKTKFDNGEIAVDFSPSGEVTEIDNSAIEDVGLESGTFVVDLNVNNFSKITSSLNELKFNFGLRKSISKRINMNFGISYSRLLNVNNKSLAINFEKVNGFNDPNFYHITNSELYTKGAYSNFDVSPHIGLEYNFLPNANFGLNYYYGMKNLIARTELDQLTSLAKNESIYRRNIEAKIRYSF